MSLTIKARGLGFGIFDGAQCVRLLQTRASAERVLAQLQPPEPEPAAEPDPPAPKPRKRKPKAAPAE